MRREAFTSRRSQRPGGTLWLLSSIARARGAGGRLTLITNMAAGSSSNYWEDLRKQARQLENELDLKLVSFSKLCTSYSHNSAREGRRDRYSSDTTPLLNGSSQDRMFETMAVEIEQLLGRLTGINDKMAEYTNSAGVPSLNAALMHTLQRHRDILQDYTHEFHKTKTNFLAVRERENLLGSVRKDIESYKSGSGVNNRRTELFLKEHEHLRNSDRLIEETISIAMATKENMTSQRGILKSIQSKMNTLASILSERAVLRVPSGRSYLDTIHSANWGSTYFNRQWQYNSHHTSAEPKIALCLSHSINKMSCSD
ncbi:zinc finger protein 160-like protein [Platysternon megacephalum]|uniref:Golgi SNAP receptor complex member 1 n=1 Tax=Platysternon megacephalum TaxID=55544 RepID=A0A4D9DXL0_9SAUR|nr:zinc finger protein 160-like protein [Platysternon megacephalum]